MKKNVWLAIALVLILPAMFLLTSCAKTAVQSQPAQTPQSDQPAAANNSGGTAEPGDQATAPEAGGTQFVNENIQFEFDSAVLSNQAQRILTDKAEYLRTNPGLAVTVEGHCDERGTEAYNMALGDRRAKSARDFLANMGIGTERMRTISFGEERPLAQGRDEVSWAKNRRAQFVIE